MENTNKAALPLPRKPVWERSGCRCTRYRIHRNIIGVGELHNGTLGLVEVISPSSRVRLFFYLISKGL